MVELSRRSVLQGAGVLAAAVPAAALLPTDLAYAATAVSRASLTPYVGKAFDVRAGLVRANMILMGISDLDARDAGHQHRFLLTFRLNHRAPSTRKIRQGSYRFTSGKLGTLSIFVVPDPAQAGDYVAVFNAR